mmetsp:Transcript_19057/g.27985  ORF Transcript_19057/g.27985 Transcript_19057/m.27985 type:complete len:624 (-) Transcript_19057:351-2222(-)
MVIMISPRVDQEQEGHHTTNEVEKIKNKNKSVWTRHIDPNTQAKYLYNVVTHETKWSQGDEKGEGKEKEKDETLSTTVEHERQYEQQQETINGKTQMIQMQPQRQSPPMFLPPYSHQEQRQRPRPMMEGNAASAVRTAFLNSSSSSFSSPSMTHPLLSLPPTGDSRSSFFVNPYSSSSDAIPSFPFPSSVSSNTIPATSAPPARRQCRMSIDDMAHQRELAHKLHFLSNMQEHHQRQQQQHFHQHYHEEEGFGSRYPFSSSAQLPPTSILSRPPIRRHQQRRHSMMPAVAMSSMSPPPTHDQPRSYESIRSDLHRIHRRQSLRQTTAQINITEQVTKKKHRFSPPPGTVITHSESPTIARSTTDVDDQRKGQSCHDKRVRTNLIENVYNCDKQQKADTVPAIDHKDNDEKLQPSLQPQRRLTKDYIGLAKSYKNTERYRLMTTPVLNGENLIICILCERKAEVAITANKSNESDDDDNYDITCNIRRIAKVFFPCEHQCVCDECVESHCFGNRNDDAKSSLSSSSVRCCPLCGEEIKLILDFDAVGGGKAVREKYWSWVNEVKPFIPKSFVSNFPQKSKKSISIFKQVVASVDDDDDDGGSSKISNGNGQLVKINKSQLCVIL